MHGTHLNGVEAEAGRASIELVHNPRAPVTEVIARLRVPVVDVSAHEVVVVSVFGVDSLRPVLAIALDLEDRVLSTVVVVVHALRGS